MKVWILFACEDGLDFIDMVFDSEEKAEAAKKNREAEDSGLTYRIDWFEVK